MDWTINVRYQNYRLHLVAMERWSDGAREMMEWREEARRIDLVMATFLVGSIVLGVGGSDN